MKYCEKGRKNWRGGMMDFVEGLQGFFPSMPEKIRDSQKTDFGLQLLGVRWFGRLSASFTLPFSGDKTSIVVPAGKGNVLLWNLFIRTKL
jgi:hypothetical protein